MENKNKNKIVYIDESNISTNTGCSVYCAIFIFYTDKDFLSKEIAYIENKLSIKYLHWVNMSWKLRLKFAEKIQNLNFSCRFMIYKNPINPEVVLEDFVLKILDKNKNINKIIIDGKKNNKYIHKLKNKLKNRGIDLDKLIFADDKNEELIRLTDFMAGLIRSYIDNKNEHNTYMFNLLKHKIKIPD